MKYKRTRLLSSNSKNWINYFEFYKIRSCNDDFWVPHYWFDLLSYFAQYLKIALNCQKFVYQDLWIFALLILLIKAFMESLIKNLLESLIEAFLALLIKILLKIIDQGSARIIDWGLFRIVNWGYIRVVDQSSIKVLNQDLDYFSTWYFLIIFD